MQSRTDIYKLLSKHSEKSLGCDLNLCMKSKVLYVHSWGGTIHKPFNAIRNPLSVWAQPTVAAQQRAYGIKNIF